MFIIKLISIESIILLNKFFIIIIIIMPGVEV